MTDGVKAATGIIAILLALMAVPHINKSAASTKYEATPESKEQQGQIAKRLEKLGVETRQQIEAKAKIDAENQAKEQAAMQAKLAAEAEAKAWTVSTSPHAKVSVARINETLAILRELGLTKMGAAYLVGNFIAESYVTPCGVRGDGGVADGLAQWHPGRRVDMPCGLREQLVWAVNVEMPRDAAKGGYPSLAARLRDPNETPQGILLGFKQWERYGLEGNRAVYAKQVYESLGK